LTQKLNGQSTAGGATTDTAKVNNVYLTMS